MPRILIVDDDKQLGDFMLMLIEGMGHEVELATNGTLALELLAKFRHDVVFTDVHMEPLNGLELVDRVKQLYPQAVFVFMSGDANPDLQNQGLRRGALEFLHKPIRVDQLKQVLRRALSRSDREKSAVTGGAATGTNAAAAGAGSRTQTRQTMAAVELELESFYAGPPFAALRRKLAQIAFGSRYTLLEAAKGMLSADLWDLLHANGPAASLALRIRDAATEPITSIEDVLLPTNQGTLVLQNLEAVPLEIQKGLAGELQHARKMRFIATTERDPDQLMVDGRIHGGLYSRLALGVARLPPLAERDTDIPEMMASVLRHGPYYPFGSTLPEIDEPAREVLRAHSWPENLEELWAVANRAVSLMKEPRLTLAELPDRIRGARLPTLGQAVAAAEAAHIERAVRVTGSIERAAQVLGLSVAEVEACRGERHGESLFLMKRELTAPIPVSAPAIERVLVIAADAMVRQTATAALIAREVEVYPVADGLAALAAIVAAPRPFSVALLISPLTLFDPLELALELRRLAPGLKLGLMGGRAPDADPGPFSIVAPSFRTATDAEAILQALNQSLIQRPAA